MKVGLVGLPNVGKSTLFNALSRSSAVAENFPFSTVEPNVGMAVVPDVRLDTLAQLSESERKVPTSVQFVDIAGLVEGASSGAGLGNQFLSHIRDVTAVCHVVRCFADDQVVHVAGRVDPLSDVEVINTELLIKDLETVERRSERAQRSTKSGDKDAIREAQLVARLHEHLAEGRNARDFDFGDAPQLPLELGILTAKPALYVANVAEGDLPDGGPSVDDLRVEVAPVIVLCAEIEAALVDLTAEDRLELLQTCGLDAPGLDRLIHAAYAHLGLVTFLTTGPKESRAWTIRAGSSAAEAAAQIHSDIQRGFIRAEVIAYEDFIAAGSEAQAKRDGLMRAEGRDYVVRDGDVVHFRFNV